MFCYIEYNNNKYHLDIDKIIDNSTLSYSHVIDSNTMIINDILLRDDKPSIHHMLHGLPTPKQDFQSPESKPVFKDAIRSKLQEIADSQSINVVFTDLNGNERELYTLDEDGESECLTVSINARDVQSAGKICMDEQFGEYLAKTEEMKSYIGNGTYELAVIQGHVHNLPVGNPIKNMSGIKDEEQLFLPPRFFGLPVIIIEDDIKFHSYNNGFMQVRGQ